MESKKGNKKNSFEDAATTAMDSPQVMRRKEVTGELNFINNLDELDAALEADNIVARFNNPIDPDGDPIDFEMRPMTPGETATYYQTLLGHTFLEAAAGGNPNPDTELELDEEQEQRVQDELAVKKYDTKLLNILESCILFPPGVTAKRMRKWDPFYIISLHNGLMNGSRPSKSVARFPDVDSPGRE